MAHHSGGGHRRGEYKRVADRAKVGDYDLVEPLDFLILDQLAEEGETFAGLYQIGTSTKELVDSFDKKIPSSALGGRLHALKAYGLVISVRIMGKKSQTAWQRTPNGKKLLDEWKTKKEKVGDDND